MSRDGKRRRGLSYEDRVLWTAVSKGFKPLRTTPADLPGEASNADADDAASAVTHAPPAKRPAKQTKPAQNATAAAPKKLPPTPQPVMQPVLLGRRMKRSVARGKEPIEARLDLHGLTQSEAHGALMRFLRNAQARDARLVLVITGKGRGGETGVLRRQVPQWLGLAEFRALVVGFQDAHVAHGGKGALYVRLRRGRNE